MSKASALLKTFALSAMAAVATSCGGGDDPKPNPGPNPEPGTFKTYSVTGKAGSVSFNKADSTVTFWQKNYGVTAADDKLVSATISASTKAKGSIVTFENSLIRTENIQRMAGQILYLKDYNLGTAVSAEGKYIGQTPDGKNKIKDMRFTGTELQILAEGAKTIEDVTNVIENPNLQWKLIGDKATGYGGADKVYRLAVN